MYVTSHVFSFILTESWMRILIKLRNSFTLYVQQIYILYLFCREYFRLKIDLHFYIPLEKTKGTICLYVCVCVIP